MDERTGKIWVDAWEKWDGNNPIAVHLLNFCLTHSGTKSPFLGAPVILNSSYFSAVDLISNQAASLLPLLARLPPFHWNKFRSPPVETTHEAKINSFRNQNRVRGQNDSPGHHPILFGGTVTLTLCDCCTVRAWSLQACTRELSIWLVV